MNKNTITSVVIVIACLFFSIAAYNDIANRYTMDATVYEISDNTITFEDTTGNLWDIDRTIAAKKGDVYELTFNTNGTDEERIDDKITKIVKKDLTNE